VSELPINLSQVADKIAFIQKAKSTSWVESATAADLETIRTELRGLMRFRAKKTGPTFSPLFINVREDATEFQVETHKAQAGGARSRRISQPRRRRAAQPHAGQPRPAKNPLRPARHGR
jgi:type I site-specific restriction endonuclease